MTPKSGAKAGAAAVGSAQLAPAASIKLIGVGYSLLNSNEAWEMFDDPQLHNQALPNQELTAYKSPWFMATEVITNGFHFTKGTYLWGAERG